MNPKSMEFAENSEGYEEMIDIQVYPNPANDKLNVEIIGEIENDFIFELFNSVGIKVFEKDILPRNSITDIDVAALKQGIYWYRALDVRTGEQIGTGQLIINR